MTTRRTPNDLGDGRRVDKGQETGIAILNLVCMNHSDSIL